MRTSGFYWVQRDGKDAEVGRWDEAGYWLLAGSAALLVDDSFISINETALVP
jgi:hypothetical protein